MQLPGALSDPMRIYLNDHLSGAYLGADLARRSYKANKTNNEFGPILEQIAQEIDEDRKTLEEMMERLKISQSPLKTTMGWAAEKVGRLKLNGQITGYSSLSRLVELDGLNGGIHAKLALWRALEAVADRTPGLDQAELENLVGRAKRQLDRLAELQKKAAVMALSRTGASPGS